MSDLKHVDMKVLQRDEPDVFLECECGRQFWSGPAPEECVVFIRDGNGAWPNPGRLYSECPDCHGVNRPCCNNHVPNEDSVCGEEFGGTCCEKCPRTDE